MMSCHCPGRRDKVAARRICPNIADEISKSTTRSLTNDHRHADDEQYAPSSMEVNKDEAQRCLSIAIKNRDQGSLSAAIKFTRKSISLYSTPEAEDLLAKLLAQEKSAPTPGPSKEANGSTASASGAQAHPPAGGTSRRHAEPEPPKPKREFTPAQAKVVKRVRACKTHEYYEILELSKECDEDGIKKAYRKVRSDTSQSAATSD